MVRQRAQAGVRVGERSAAGVVLMEMLCELFWSALWLVGDGVAQPAW